MKRKKFEYWCLRKHFYRSDLDDKGKDGWELCTVIVEGWWMWRTEMHIFKREVIDGDQI